MSLAGKLYLERPGTFRNVRTFVVCSQTRSVLPGRADCVPYMHVQVLFFFFKGIGVKSSQEPFSVGPSIEEPISVLSEVKLPWTTTED